jgi:hypothetical protein
MMEYFNVPESIQHLFAVGRVRFAARCKRRNFCGVSRMDKTFWHKLSIESGPISVRPKPRRPHYPKYTVMDDNDSNLGGKLSNLCYFIVLIVISPKLTFKARAMPNIPLATCM